MPASISSAYRKAAARAHDLDGTLYPCLYTGKRGADGRETRRRWSSEQALRRQT